MQEVGSYVDDSPAMSAQRRQLAVIAESPRVAAQRAVVSRLTRARRTGGLGPAAAGSSPVAQRLIVNAGHDKLLAEAAKSSGWITLKTLDVGLHMDDAPEVIEKEQLDGHAPIGPSENIFIVGHGAAGKMAATDPKFLAGELKKVIPDQWKGFVLGLTCNAGLAAKGEKDSGGKQLHDALGGAPVAAARGSTFTHMGIDMAIRVIKEDKNYAADFRKHYLTQVPFTPQEMLALLKLAFPSSQSQLASMGEGKLAGTFQANFARIDTTSSEFAKIIDTKDLSGLDERSQESRQVDALHGSTDKQWLTYMASKPSDLKAMAAKATALSEEFYEVAVAYGEKHDLFHEVSSNEEYEYHE